MSRTLRLAAIVLAFSLFVTGCDSKKPDAPGAGGAAAGAGVSGGGGAATAQPMAKPPAMLDLMPEGAVGVVYIASLNGAEEATKRLVATGDPEQAKKVKLGDFAQMQGIDPADLDMTRGAAIVMTLKDASSPPGVTAIVPVKDEKAAAGKIKGQNPGATVETAAGFAAVTPQGPYKKGGIPAKLAGPLPQGDVVVRIDAETLVKTFGPMAFGKMNEAIENLGPEGATAKSMVQGLQSAMEAASLIDLVLRSSGTQVELDVTVTFSDRSKASFLDAFAKADLAKLAASVPDGGMFDLAASIDFQKVWPAFEGFVKASMEMYPPEARAALQKMLAKLPEMMKSMGHGMAMTARIPSTGMEASAAFETQDASAYLKAVADVYAGLDLKDSPMAVSPVEDRTVDGVKVKTWKIKPDTTKFAGTAQGADPEKVKAALNMVFGKDGLTLNAVDLGTKALFVMGNDEVVKNAIKTAKAGSPTALSKSLAAAGSDTVGYIRYDMRAVMNMVSDMAKSNGKTPPMNVSAGDPVNLFVIMNASGSQLRIRTSADVGKFVELFKSSMPK